MALDLRDLERANRSRCEAPNGFAHSILIWRVSQWTNALAGEAGEACNLAKKLDRHEDGARGNYKPGDLDVEALHGRLGRELGDVVIYADLVAQRLGLSLSDLVRAAFNEKSQSIGYEGRI